MKSKGFGDDGGSKEIWMDRQMGGKMDGWMTKFLSCVVDNIVKMCISGRRLYPL